MAEPASSAWQTMLALINAGADPTDAAAYAGVSDLYVKRLLFENPVTMGSRRRARRRAIVTARAAARVAAFSRLLKEDPQRWWKIALLSEQHHRPAERSETERAIGLANICAVVARVIGQQESLREELLRELAHLPEGDEAYSFLKRFLSEKDAPAS